MTILGKMLVFLVLVLTLVWNGLVVNAYVTRTNWRAEAKRSQDKAVEAADSANKMKGRLESERESSESAVRVLREENARLYEQVKALNDQLKTLTKQYTDSFDGAQKEASQIATFQSNVDKLQKQLDSTTALLAQKEKDIDDLTKAAERDRVLAQKASLDAQSQMQRAERLATRVQELAEDNENFKRGGGRQTGVGERAVPAPEGFRGTIRRVSRDPAGGDILVTLTPGLDAGLQQGAMLAVSREKPTPKYLGKIVIVLADPKEAVGRFLPPPGVRLSPEDLPQINDTLAPATR